MGLDFQKAIEDARKASMAAEQERAAKRGVSPEQLREMTELQLERSRQLAALADSGIALRQGDDARIVDGDFRRTPALEHVQRWAAAKDGRPILVLCGGVGVGKTMAAGVLIAQATTGRVVASRQLSEVVVPWAADIARGVRPLNMRAALLILDDLGTEDPKRDRRWPEAFAALIDARQMHGRTLITTNMTRKDFRKRYDDRLISRLNAAATAVEIGGDSLRETGGGL